MRSLFVFPALILILAGCGASAPPEPLTYDVPALMGKNIDELKTTLGPPDSDEEIQIGETDAKEWPKNGKMLMATFYIRSRKVEDFFIPCDNTSGECSDKEHLLQIGNLKENDPRYSIEFVNAAGAGANTYTGVKATAH